MGCVHVSSQLEAQFSQDGFGNFSYAPILFMQAASSLSVWKGSYTFHASFLHGMKLKNPGLPFFVIGSLYFLFIPVFCYSLSSRSSSIPPSPRPIFFETEKNGGFLRKVCLP